MNTGKKAAFLVLLMMLSSGCLGAIEDVIDDTVEILEGEYPQLDLPIRDRTNPNLQNYNQCTELLEDLRSSLYEEMLVNLDQESYWHWASPIWRGGGALLAEDVAMMDGAAEATDDSGTAYAGGSAESDSGREGEFSGTNNQESGVDEADFLKTDGYHIYMLNGNQLVIMGVPEFGNLTLESNISIEGAPLQMMLEGDRLVIASAINYWQLPEDSPLRPLMSQEVTVKYGDSEEESYTYIQVQSLVKYTVVDISDREAPVIDREIYIEGNYHTARLVDGTVRSVTHLSTYIEGLRHWVSLPDDYWSEEDLDKRMDMWNQSMLETIAHNSDTISALTLDDFSPHMYEMTSSGIFEFPISSEGCSEFSASSDSAGRGFTTIMTLDLFGQDVEMEVDHITSSWSHVYASQDTLVLAEPANDWWWFWRNTGWDDATNIHSFDISEPGATTYVASGRVDGTVQDQFSISEYNGVIRVATTEDAWGRWWLDGTENWTGPTNNVFTLDVSQCMIPEGCGEDYGAILQQIGHIGDIAEGERIWSARFVGDRAYLVTFQNIDPLWVIDLTDPTDPTVLGELEVPGVSTYIHPIDEETLLTIGIGPGEDGLGLDWSVTQVSLFDVSDPTNPTLSDVMPLSPAYDSEGCESSGCGWSWSYSEATYEHKAFTYWAPEGLLAVPLSTYRYTYDEIEVDGRVYHYSGYEFVSTLELIDVDIENGTLSNHGMVNHSSFYNEDGLSGWWAGSSSIRRSIFMGDFIYAFSTAGATVHRTEDMHPVAHIELPGYESPEAYYYVEEESATVDSESSSEETETHPCNEPEAEGCED